MLRAMLIATALSWLAVPALAQAPRPVTTYKAPRAADGHPDLQGVWTNASLTRLERPARYGHRMELTEPEAAEIEGHNDALIALGNKPTAEGATVKDLPADCSDGRGTDCNYNAGWTDPGSTVMRVAGKPRSAFITWPKSGRVPMKPGLNLGPYGRQPLPPGLAINDNPESRSPGERCLLSFGSSSGPVMQPVLYNNLYEIVQTQDQVVLVVEMVHDARIVRLGAKHLPASLRPWMGDSIGWWEGDTLVVETTNFHPQQTFRGASEHLKVTERFTRVGPGRLHYGFWVEDPTVFSEPWGGEYEFSRTKGPVFEYACHEGNYGLHGILAGAREEERSGKKASAPAQGDDDG
jgi:hypothetical protein